MAHQTKRVVIIGGGISGLSAAYYAQKKFSEQAIPVEIVLIEKDKTLGGKIQTLHRDDFVLERGPDSFLARKMPIIDLIRDLGLEDELTATNPLAKKNYILKQNRLHRMPPGLVLGIPTEVTPFIKTGLISPLGKARAAMDLVLPKRDSGSDESLGSFLERRLGKEVLEHIAEPLLAGIYAGDTHSLSLQATFPQFQQLEQKHRSLILGMMQSKKQVPQAAKLPEIAKKSMFLTFKKGLKTLVDSLIEHLHSIELKTGQGVHSVNRINETYHVELEDGQKLTCGAMILALPVYQTAKLLHDVPEAKVLNQIPYVSVANIILAFEQKDIARALDGSGFVIPRSEGRFITACTWTSSKWLHASPKGKVLLRCYIGRSGEEQWTGFSDEQLLSKVRSDLTDLMGITAEPLFYEVTRWMNSMPQYPVGHLESISQVRKALADQKPGTFLTGSGYHGVGLPDCIRQGKEAAEQAFSFISAPLEKL
jgi:oxygen-dependent protoporphyrinogen oxidase